MLKPKVEEILVQQIGKEIYSSNLYLSMASWADRSGLEGTANWLYAQAEEEKIHMLKFVKYINDRGGRAIIGSVEAPESEFKNIHELFKKVLEHEEMITDSINEIVGTTISEKDFTTHQWIQWFVTEQIEEEKSVRSIIDKLSLLGENGNLYHFDKDVFALRAAGASANA